MRLSLHILCASLIALMGFSAWATLRAQDVLAGKHLEITGSQRLRITYDSSFVWPAGGGYSAVMDLPIPPDTGAQHIESFTSTLQGHVETDPRAIAS
jgi:hypothetical protein